MKRYKIRKVGTDEYVEDLLITSDQRCTVWWCKDLKSAKNLTKEEVLSYKEINGEDGILVYKVKVPEEKETV